MPHGPDNPQTAEARIAELKVWMAELNDWIASHPPTTHTVDGNREDAYDDTTSFPSRRRPEVSARGRLFSSDDVMWHAAIIEGRILFFGSIVLAVVALAWEVMR